MYLRRLYD
ncbi:hypothetical protein YPPY56_1124, partial [Yersinia pestis PY-56]